MKTFARFISLLVCIAILLGMIGCTETPAENPPSTAPVTEPTQAPTAPPADQVYQNAVDQLNSMTDISLDLLVTKTTLVAGEAFTQQSQQILTYSDIGSNSASIMLTELGEFDIPVTDSEDTQEENTVTPTDDPAGEPAEEPTEESTDNANQSGIEMPGLSDVLSEEDDADTHNNLDAFVEIENYKQFLYSEIYADGMLYISLELSVPENEIAYRFSSPLTEDSAVDRYIPPLLINYELYGDVRSELSDDGVVLHFSEPVAPESWAIPEGAEWIDTSASAKISKDGNFEQMQYAVTYQYGPAQITLEILSKPTAEVPDIQIPEDSDRYTKLDYPDALKVYLNSIAILFQSEALTTTLNNTIITKAAEFVWNQSITLNRVKIGENLISKYVMDDYQENLYSGKKATRIREVRYLDGVQTTIVNDGVPTVEKDIAVNDVEKTNLLLMLTSMPDPKYWTNATLSEINGFQIIDFSYSEEFSSFLQNSSCRLLFDDITALNQLASDYRVEDSSGYLSLNTYTQIPTGAGYCYKGVHTIENREYALTNQCSQSFDIPGLDAYYEITGEFPEEEQGEKATPLFYHVTAPDGAEAWFLGTIVLGDERTAHLPQEVYDALESSDVLVLEYYMKQFEKDMKSDPVRRERYPGAFYSRSKNDTAKQELSEEYYDRALMLLKASGNYNAASDYFRLYMWSRYIRDLYLKQNYQLSSSQSILSRIEKMAEDMDMPIEQLVSYDYHGKYATMQDVALKYMLEKTVDTDFLTYGNAVLDQYGIWCAGNEDVMRAILSSPLDTASMTEEERNTYIAALYQFTDHTLRDNYSRIIECMRFHMQKEEVAFFAVDISLLLTEYKDLFEVMRNSGYTVELVEYAQ